MKKNTILTILTFLLFNLSFGQDKEKYLKLIDEAWQFYENKEYLKSGQKYSEAFKASENKETINNRYDAACSWALANKPDSSFIQLFKIATTENFTNLKRITTDKDLNSLYTDEKWNEVIEIVKSNKKKAEINFDKPLIAILDTIYQEDQKYRQQNKQIQEKYGWESDQMKNLIKIIIEKDSINLIKIEKILNERGWLGANIIGKKGNSTLFLVIQHSKLETQEKYLPMMHEAVIKGNAKASSLALLEDRVALRKGKKQIYGSQIGRDLKTNEYYVLPLIDPDNVNERRATVGLFPIQDYISHWGLTWNAENYKNKFPEYIAK